MNAFTENVQTELCEREIISKCDWFKHLLMEGVARRHLRGNCQISTHTNFPIELLYVKYNVKRLN